MKKSSWLAFSLSTILLVLLLNISLLAVPSTISYQGQLNDNSGNPVADDSYSILFTIYDANIGGNNLWDETQVVTTTDGRFHVKLGGVDTLPDSVFEYSSIYLGVAIGADPEMIPRIQLQSAPFSQKSKISELSLLSKDAEKLDGIELLSFALKDSANTFNKPNNFNFPTHFYGKTYFHVEPLIFVRGIGNRWYVEEGFDYGLRFRQYMDDADVVQDRTVFEITDKGDVDILGSLNAGGTVTIGGVSGYELPLTSGVPGDVLTTVAGGVTLWSPPPSGGSSWNWSDSSSFGPDSVKYAQKTDTASVALDADQLGGLDQQDFIMSDSINAFNNYNWFNTTTNFAGPVSLHDNRFGFFRSSNPRWNIEEKITTGLTFTQYYDDADVVQNRIIMELTDGGDVEFAGSLSTGGGAVINGNFEVVGNSEIGQDNINTSTFSSIGGGTNNQIVASVKSVISGGNYNAINNSDYASIGGGTFNAASGETAHVGGGSYNFASGDSSAVVGGHGNKADALYSLVGAGLDNQALSMMSLICGGSNNIVSDTETFDAGEYGLIVGGLENRVSGHAGTVVGGKYNSAAGNYAVILGGYCDTASASYSAIGGGYINKATGSYSSIPGGYTCEANGSYSFAAGMRAKANHSGSFVYGDSYFADITSSATDQFTVRSRGGVRFFTNSSLTTGAILAAGGGSWASVSDRNVKENIQPIDGDEILKKISDLEISRWNYETQDESIQHIGPMAQDFYELFGVGDNNTTITTIDPDGISLAAIKALIEKNKHLESEVAELKELVNKLIESK